MHRSLNPVIFNHMSDLDIKTETVDPRVRRTRQMLQDALGKLLTEKEFDKISVQDIADAAVLHRATFYDHYPDKFSLLECMVGSRFQELLAKRGVSFNGCTSALRAIILGVCDYLASMSETSCGRKQQLEKHMESAIIAVVRKMFLEGMELHPPGGGISPELASATVSWAIYGAANEWVLTPDRCPTEHIVEKIEQLVAPIFFTMNS
jgi:AcrR family transcriptional regulator